MTQFVEGSLGAGTLRIETGKVAKQAGGAVWVSIGDTIVLATATMSHTVRPGMDFFPLTCDYEERKYAVGKIPGGFIKRGGRPSEKSILSSRLIDRSIRPLFPYGMRNEVQVIASTLSVDHDFLPDTLAVFAASAALMVSDIPFEGPIGCVRIGRIDGEFIVNPTLDQLNESELDLIVSGNPEIVNMLEAGASEVSEEVVLEAIELAQKIIGDQCKLQIELAEKVGKAKRQVEYHLVDASILDAVREKTGAELRQAIQNPDKAARESGLTELKNEIVERLSPEFPEQTAALSEAVEKVVKEQIRGLILDEKVRPDGRKLDQIRQIDCEVGLLPRVHGSGLFTRGQTQVLTAVTLGSTDDSQSVDGLEGDYEKRYMHFYNFPPYSVGEARPMRGPGRREIGHGALAERALLSVIPGKDIFPYALLLTSECLESNGSTSMGSTCGSTLALMDAGVPIKAPVSGIAMGLMTRGDEYEVLSDIQGMEDFSGDMDFKVAGTAEGITAIQLDTKIHGLTPAMVKDTFAQAKTGRAFILGRMLEAIAESRPEMSQYAPRVTTIKINPEKIGALIGPGGKNIKAIEAESGAKLSIEQDGTVYISAVDGAGGEKAVSMVKAIAADVAVGEKFTGKVTRTMGMGAFVEIVPGKEGLVHSSNLSEESGKRPDSVVSVGDMIEVRVIELDPQGRINLSAIQLGDDVFDAEAAKARAGAGRGPGGGGGRFGGGGGRDRDRGGDRGGRFGGDRDRGPRPSFDGPKEAPKDPAGAEPSSDDETPKARFRPRR
jgi:polyribonucleotide nucleotidyltransferase